MNDLSPMLFKLFLFFYQYVLFVDQYLLVFGRHPKVTHCITCPGVVSNEEVFTHNLGQPWVSKLFHESKIRIMTWNIGRL